MVAEVNVDAPVFSEAMLGRLPLRAHILFRISDALWAASRAVDRPATAVGALPGMIVSGFGDLCNELGGRLGARVERKLNASG